VPGKRLLTWAIALLVTFVMFQPDVLRYFSLRLECDSFMLSVVEERHKPPLTLGCVIHYLGMMGLSNCCQTILTNESLKYD